MATRRAFLTSIAGAAAAPVLDPDRLLWVFGARKFFIPPAPRVLTVDELSRVYMGSAIKGILEQLERQLRFAALLDRQFYEGASGFMTGDVINIRKPARFGSKVVQVPQPALSSGIVETADRQLPV